MELICSKYRVITVIKDRGSMRVYLAEHINMGIKRIIKESRDGGAMGGGLRREAYILGRLKHPMLPALCDIEDRGKSFYIVEEYIEGKTIYDHIKENGVFGWQEGLKYGVKLAEIIDFLHSGSSLRISHLDIQPKNIIVNEGRLHLVDFGNACIWTEAEAESPMMGTEGFAPPEQYSESFKGGMKEGAAADIYGFGAVLFYMLTGRLPKEQACDLLLKRGVPRQMGAVIELALNRDAAYRQNTMGVIRSQLVSMAKGKEPEKEKGWAFEREKVCNLSKLSKQDTALANEAKPKSGETEAKEAPFVISVAGTCSGVGTTYAALEIAKLLRSENFLVLYEECNETDMVRLMAKTYPDIRYERGLFIYNDIRLKPKYGQGIGVEAYAEVFIRDEGVYEPEKSYGDVLILVMGADMLGWCRTAKALEAIEKCGRKKYGLLNMCRGESLKRLKGRLAFQSSGLPYREAGKESHKEAFLPKPFRDWLKGLVNLRN